MTNYQEIYDEILKDRDYIISLRRYFHTYPEVSCKEFATAKKIEEELDALGLKHHRVAQTGVVTEIKGLKAGNKVIVLRADIDALPLQEEHDVAYCSQNKGVMHACGHDAHIACLIGAIRALVKHRDLFGGTVLVTFQPAEEIGYGARAIIKEGVIDHAQRSFGIHVSSAVPVGKIVVATGANRAAVDQFKIIFHGLAGHVSTPELAVDAVYMAAQYVVEAQALVTRKTSPVEPVLIGIGRIEAGTAYNIIAKEAVIEGTLRTLNEETRKKINHDLKALAEYTAQLFGGSVEYMSKDNTSVLINDEKATLEVQKTAKRIFGDENVITDTPIGLGGDDMAEYIKKVPGVYAYVGTRNENKQSTTAAHHTIDFDIDEDGLRVGAAIYACYAVDYLNNN